MAEEYLGGLKFLFIGPYKNYAVEKLIEAVEVTGGSGIERSDDEDIINYVVLPNEVDFATLMRNEEFTKAVNRGHKPKVVFLNFLLDCFTQKKLVSDNRYSVNTPIPSSTPLLEDQLSSESEDKDKKASPVKKIEEVPVAMEEIKNTESEKNKYPSFYHQLFENEKFRVWREYKTQEGRPYYYNVITGLTQWDRPEGFEEFEILSDEELRQQSEQVRQVQLVHQYSHQMMVGYPGFKVDQNHGQYDQGSNSGYQQGRQFQSLPRQFQGIRQFQGLTRHFQGIPRSFQSTVQTTGGGQGFNHFFTANQHGLEKNIVGLKRKGSTFSPLEHPNKRLKTVEEE